MQKEGIWFPISKINSGQHLIKLEGYDNTFNDEWEQKFEIEGFNLKIEGGLWISDICYLQWSNVKMKIRERLGSCSSFLSMKWQILLSTDHLVF